MLQQAVEACDKKQQGKHGGLADMVGSTSIVTLHAGLGFSSSHTSTQLLNFHYNY
jgi:hypothetical protein